MEDDSVSGTVGFNRELPTGGKNGVVMRPGQEDMGGRARARGEPGAVAGVRDRGRESGGSSREGTGALVMGERQRR